LLFDKCVASVKRQTVPVEQVFIRDDNPDGCGSEAAKRMFMKLRPEEVHGEYVMILDDDDVMVYDDLAKDIFTISCSCEPDMFIFRGELVGLGVVPGPHTWKKPPVIAQIGSFCYAVKKNLWFRNIHVYAGMTLQQDGNVSICASVVGDFEFASQCYKDSKNTYWLDVIACKTQHSEDQRKRRVRGILK